MGTRSLLGWADGETVRFQYMQFDGGPVLKGRQFYENVLHALSEGRGYFGDARPNKKFFTMVKQFLDFYQYETSHSFNSRYSCPAQEWNDQDYGAEWRYLWRADGAFVIEPWDGATTFIIPWELTKALARVTQLNYRDEHEDSKLMPLWTALQDWEPKKAIPKLSARCRDLLMFPEQKDDGWRDATDITVGREVVANDCFGGVDAKDVKVRDEKVVSAVFRSEVLEVKRADIGLIPAIMHGLRSEEAKKLAEGRLTKEK